MITKQEVINKLDALKAYSVQQKPDFETYYTELMQPVYDAVNAYFNTSRSNFVKPVTEYVFQAYCDINVRNQQWEIDIPYNYPTDYPTGYNDLRDCFYSFNSLLSITNEQFFNVWVEETPTTGGTDSTGGGTLTPVPVSNPYLTTWQTEITDAPTGELSKINACVEWLKNSGDNTILIDLLEDRGTLISSMEREDIALMIYNDRHVLEVLNERNISAYIPSYIGD